MHELTAFGRRAILRWIKGHTRFAEPLLSRPKGDPCRSLAANILGCADELRAGLARYEQPESRRRELLLETVNEWKKKHPERRELPQDMWRELDAEAAKRAFRERYPDLAKLADDIAEMRTDAELKFKC